MSGDLYYPIYLTVVGLFTYYNCMYYWQTSCYTLENRNVTFSISSFFLALTVSVLIGLRPKASCFIDMNNYIALFEIIEQRSFQFDYDTENIFFDNFFSWIAASGFHWSVFFLIIALIYFMGMWICSRKLFPHDTLIAFLACLGAFSTFSYGTNGVKAGAAASLFLIALANHANGKKAILFLLLSLSFHHSMVLPIVAFALAWYYRNTRAYFYIWIFSLLCAILHISFFQILFAGFTDERGAEYLMSSGESWGGKSGFRIDFVIYSIMPVLVGYWALFKKFVESRTYEFILSVYLITNSVWMLCMYANFTNRIAYLSWFMYPIVLIYPFLEKSMGDNRYKMLALAVFLHVMFTIMMQVVYY